ncbi:MAG: hypothetical protein HGA67_01325 [Candidatus Yonathbacteria bacterium]|nr:hypothetical protein [Candidatus Yonathbacteria bacterium]
MITKEASESLKRRYEAVLAAHADGEPFVIVNACTHGHEHIGLRVAETLKSDPSLASVPVEYMIGNEEACSRSVQYIDTDLNRAFPGKEDGNYEEVVAFFMSPLITKAAIVFDIHSTTTFSLGEQSAVIVTRSDAMTRRVIEAIRPPKAIIMKATENSALISQARIGIGMEYGGEDDWAVVNAVVGDIKRALAALGMIETESPSWHTWATEYYEVYGTIEKPSGYVLADDIVNYNEVSVGDVYARHGNDVLRAKESFYPFLFGENRYHDIFGFCARRLPRFE